MTVSKKSTSTSELDHFRGDGPFVRLVALLICKWAEVRAASKRSPWVLRATLGALAVGIAPTLYVYVRFHV